MEQGSRLQRQQHRRHQSRRSCGRYPHYRTAHFNRDRRARSRHYRDLLYSHRSKALVGRAHLTSPPVDLAGTKIGLSRNLRHVCARRRYRHHQRPFLLIRPETPTLNTRNYRHLTHGTVSNTGANTSACTGAISKTRSIHARRPQPEAYAPREVGLAGCARWTEPARLRLVAVLFCPIVVGKTGGTQHPCVYGPPTGVRGNGRSGKRHPLQRRPSSHPPVPRFSRARWRQAGRWRGVRWGRLRSSAACGGPCTAWRAEL